MHDTKHAKEIIFTWDKKQKMGPPKDKPDIPKHFQLSYERELIGAHGPRRIEFEKASEIVSSNSKPAKFVWKQIVRGRILWDLTFEFSTSAVSMWSSQTEFVLIKFKLTVEKSRQEKVWLIFKIRSVCNAFNGNQTRQK